MPLSTVCRGRSTFAHPLAQHAVTIDRSAVDLSQYIELKLVVAAATVTSGGYICVVMNNDTDSHRQCQQRRGFLHEDRRRQRTQQFRWCRAGAGDA